MNIEKIAGMVRFHRKKARLTQQQLAELSGVGKTVIFDIENGKLSIQLMSLFKVLKILNIQIEFTGPIMHLYTQETQNSG